MSFSDKMYVAMLAMLVIATLTPDKTLESTAYAYAIIIFIVYAISYVLQS